MENQSVYFSSLICNTLNTIFSKIFSSIDNTIYTNLDNILFINPDIINNLKFKQIFGTDPSNGLLLLSNSLILGIILFYVLRFALSHLTYSKIDSPYQFIFKCIIFIACMNSSLWICEKIIFFISLISDFILEIGYLVSGQEINFSNLINSINSLLYSTPESFDFFCFNGILKTCTSLTILYILLIYSIRLISCKTLILLAPFAFLSLSTNHLDGFFKGWLKQFVIILTMQIFVAVVLVLGFSLEFYSDDLLSKLIYFAIVAIIAKCNYSVKELFKFIYEYSHNTLKEFI